MSSAFDLQARLAKLKQNYINSMPERAKALEAAAEPLAHAWNSETAVQLRTLAHQLAGSGGSYGFYDLTELARALEIRLYELAEQPSLPNSSALAEIQARVSNLCQALRTHASEIVQS